MTLQTFHDMYQGHHGRQGSQGLVLGWILRNRKRQYQRQLASEVAAIVAFLPAKNLPWRHLDIWVGKLGKYQFCH